MVKYGNQVRKIVENSLDSENKKNSVFDLINNKFLTQVLIFENIPFTTYIKFLLEKFNAEELKKYREVFLKNEVFANEIIPFQQEHLILMMRKLGINSQDRRDEYRNKTNELFKLLLEMCDGSKESYFEFCKKYEEYVFSKNEGNNYKLRNYIPLGIVLRIVGDRDNPLNTEYELRKKIKFLRHYEANGIITDIKYEVANLLGIRKRKNTKDILDNVKVLIEDDKEEKEENIKEIETLESVKLERDQYKSSLLLIQRGFEELREKIQEETENAVNEQIKEFFVSLNSGKYGNFLDKMPLTEELLKDIRKNNIEIPQEVKRVLMFIKSIIKFIKDTGIVPIREMDSIFTGTAEDIAEMDYIGNEFEDGEIKKLKVVAPGYKYKDIIISIPKVEEVEE